MHWKERNITVSVCRWYYCLLKHPYYCLCKKRIYNLWSKMWLPWGFRIYQHTKKNCTSIQWQQRNGNRNLKCNIIYSCSKENEIQGMYNKNYKMMIKEIKEDLNPCRNIPYSQTGWVNIVKMLILSKLMDRFKATPINVQLNYNIKILQKTDWKVALPKPEKSIKSNLLKITLFIIII